MYWPPWHVEVAKVARGRIASVRRWKKNIGKWGIVAERIYKAGGEGDVELETVEYINYDRCCRDVKKGVRNGRIQGPNFSRPE
jgi:hypothetical protein